MYDELVKELREAEKEAKELFTNPYRFIPYYGEAADAIEDLQRQIDGWIEQERKALIKSLPRWIPVTEKNHPKAYEPVVVVYIGWNDALPHRDCTAYWSEDEEVWRWAETNDKVKVPITHYMPLPPVPEPPEENGKSET